MRPGISLLHRPVPRGSWEVALPLAVLACRAWAYPIADLWRDWITLLAFHWIFAALGSRSRAWPYVTGCAMAGLLLLYAWRQLPLSIAALGLAR